MQVLLIDDERAIRRALREILEFEGCMVDEAENGAQALEKLKANTYDLLFSDIKMPQMDGHIECGPKVTIMMSVKRVKVGYRNNDCSVRFEYTFQF